MLRTVIIFHINTTVKATVKVNETPGNGIESDLVLWKLCNFSKNNCCSTVQLLCILYKKLSSVKAMVMLTPTLKNKHITEMYCNKNFKLELMHSNIKAYIRYNRMHVNDSKCSSSKTNQ